MRRCFIAFTLLFGACSTSELNTAPDRDGGPAELRDGGVDEDRDGGLQADRDGGSATRDAGLVEGIDGGMTADAGFPPVVTLGGDRPAPLYIPEDYDGAPLPLVVLLHGYTVTGEVQDMYFMLSAGVDEHRFFAIVPTGTRESAGMRATFWNATPACCNFYGSTIDDVGYLDGLVAEAGTHVSIDPKRIYFVGHSNGGFMAYRMACEGATEIAAIVSLAGATFFDPGNCVDPEPLNVLQIHGTADTTILYGGVAAGAMRYPGAVESVTRWAARANCDTASFEDGADRNIDTALLGSETSVRTYRAGCDLGLEHELWTIQGGSHIPLLAPDFADQIIEWMTAHPRP